MWRNEPIEDEELPALPDDEPDAGVDDEADVKAHGGWGGAAAPPS
jgi:hypothetical protein